MESKARFFFRGSTVCFFWQAFSHQGTVCEQVVQSNFPKPHEVENIRTAPTKKQTVHGRNHGPVEVGSLSHYGRTKRFVEGLVKLICVLMAIIYVYFVSKRNTIYVHD